MAKAKQIATIDFDGAADLGMRLVLTSRLQEMSALKERALDWRRAEGVHDMRVASRRLRSALRDFLPYIRKRRLASSMGQVKAIAYALGRIRDQDVAIMALEKLASRAPAEVAASVQQFATARKARRDEARKKLETILNEDALAQLQHVFAAAIEAGTAVVQRGKRTGTAQPAGTVTLSYRKAARLIILERLRELESLSGALFHPLRVQPLHKMRIAAKRLRYALELFDQCGEESLSFFARKAAGLQGSLGELHDCDVWIESFGNDLSHTKRSPETDGVKQASQRAASLWLLSYFLKLRTKNLRKALLQWDEWQTKGYSLQLRQLIRS